MAYNKKYESYISGSVVEKILEQGQRLRNSMVESILNNDPLNAEVIYNKHFNTPTSSVELNRASTVTSLTKLDDKKLEAFLKGDYMTREDEKLALDTFRSMSDVDLCKTTDRMYGAYKNNCHCSTCREYHTKDLNCDIKRANDQCTFRSNTHETEPTNKITKYIEDQNRFENYKYLKFVDSFKVSVHSLTLNEAGNRKVCTSLNADKTKVPANISETFFLEYQVPENLLKNVNISKSKVNSGLDSNSVRICARRNYGEAINFRQINVHDIINLENVNLNKCELKFKLTCRNSRQKNASLLGYATFHFDSFDVSKNLTCNRGIPIVLNEKVPIVLGTLKVSLQLGCGRLYFGQEFIDAINSNDINSIVLGSDDSTSRVNKEEYNFLYGDTPKLDLNTTKPEQFHDGKTFRQTIIKKTKIPSKSNIINVRSTQNIDNEDRNVANTEYHKSAYFDSSSHRSRINYAPTNKVDHISKKELQIPKQEKTILFGFLYISEAQYLSEPLNSYITCRPFCQNETSNSRLATHSSHPVFNFCQSVPLVFDDDLLLQFRENYTVIEFWKRNEHQDVVFGLTKIPLHQFYIAYRNPVILKYLRNNKLPVIGTDWWEPIYHQSTEEVIGQVQILIALGTESQVSSLELERGFKTDVVKAKRNLPLKLPLIPKSPKLVQNKKKEISKHDIGIQTSKDNFPKVSARSVKIDDTQFREQTTNTSIQNTPREKSTLVKVDKAVQHTSEMDPKENPQNKLPEMLDSFFKQMRIVSNNTNPDNNSTNLNERVVNGNDPLTIAQSNTNMEIRKTSDLLNSLQKALSSDPNKAHNQQPKKTFRAHVNIQGALHLPARKKCKSKKSKCSGGKIEESILPSTYVTFETVPEGSLKITPVVSKCSSPQWNYNCDVVLPVDLLFNSQKRLIFKVWRKCTNTNTVPNMQTDLVLGFAALDLTVLIAGLPNVQGWFNIVDFTGKCNGQINIHLTPLENLSHFQQSESSLSHTSDFLSNDLDFLHASSTDNRLPGGDTLSRAVKRKFTELEEITRRLRLRLSTVTNDESDASNDEIADEFERDINTLCIEEDFDLINFEDEAKKLNIHIPTEDTENIKDEESILSLLSGNDKNSASSVLGKDDMETCDEKKSSSNFETESSEVTEKSEKAVATDPSLDRYLVEGKQRIDNLLEKLTLLSGDSSTFQSRYVSGCSTTNEHINIDTEAILKELDRSSMPNIHSGTKYDPSVFQELYGGSVSSEKSKEGGSSSESSLYTDSRQAPDGQGTSIEDKVVSKSSDN